MHKVKNYGRKLNEFYNSRNGQIASWFIGRKLIEIITKNPIHEESKTLLYGFTKPYAKIFPDSSLNLTPFRTSFEGEVISEYDRLPVRDAAFDRIIAIHPIDHHEFPEQVIAEFWRVLEPEGQLILVSINQHGFWNKSICEKTVGLSSAYLKEALSFNKFSTRKIHLCLSARVTNLFLATKILDPILRLIMPAKSGALIFEAQKKVFAPKGRPLKVTPSLRDLVLGPKRLVNRKDSD